MLPQSRGHASQLQLNYSYTIHAFCRSSCTARGLECWVSPGWCMENWCHQSMVPAEADRYQVVPVCFQCRSLVENQSVTSQCHWDVCWFWCWIQISSLTYLLTYCNYPIQASLPFWVYITNGWQQLLRRFCLHLLQRFGFQDSFVSHDSRLHGLTSGWPLVWKTWKCQGIWQLSGKCQGFYWKSGNCQGKILSGKSCLKLFIVNCIFVSIQVFSRSLLCVKC